MNNKISILIADDQPDIRKLVRITLECEPSYEVIEAADGAAAWMQLCCHKPDLVVLDVMMPTIDGLQLCRMIRSSPELEHTYVIMISARAQRADIEQGIKAGCNRYLCKPFSTLDLLHAVDQLVEED